MKKDWIKNLEIIVGYMPFLNIRDTVVWKIGIMNQHKKVDEIMKEIEHKNKII